MPIDETRSEENLAGKTRIAESKRRKLKFEGLEEAVAECERLLASGYQPNGRWTLAQICRHLRLVQDRNLEGFPVWMSLFAPLRPIIRWLFLPKLLRGDSPKGIPTAGMFVPPDELDDAEEVAAFKASVIRFLDHEGPYRPHPGFGRQDRKRMQEIHAAHAAHHLGFLASGVIEKSVTESSVTDSSGIEPQSQTP